MLDKHFDFTTQEKNIADLWDKENCFALENSANHQAPVFDITMPPPNANGELHLGHSYGYAIMDALARFHRLIGHRTLLLPGKDHAGIQTQVVFERKLRAEGVEIEKLTREDFYQRCYDFCVDRANYMREQEKSLGLSADWQKEIFTLDPRVSKVVYETFAKMYADGLVYKGKRMVHWSVYSQTAISDVEVEYKEENGHLWEIKYPLIERKAKLSRAEKFWQDYEKVSEIHHNLNNEQVVITINEIDWKIGEAVLIGEGEAQKVLIVAKIQEFSEKDLENLPDFAEIPKSRILKLAATSGLQVKVYHLLADVDLENHLTVATTRPETMLGDTAIAVNPKDPRYQHLIGTKVKIPLLEREIPIIADDRIDITYGTGAVKVTPAHDFTDYEIGLTHQLEQIQVIDKFGKMTEAVPAQYQGLTTQDCRKKLVDDLQKEGFLVQVLPIKHMVPIAERGKDIIEPLISEQWFVNVDQPGNSLKAKALELVRSGRLKVYPAASTKLLEQWLENLRDWNISRQILWGHRLPVWYKNKGQINEEIKISIEPLTEGDWVQDNDTFDTWFSSGQWAYSTLVANGLLDLDNPSKSHFFPTHTMVMGRDILFFWSCRMLLLTAYRLNDLPWQNIYFTGLIRDEKGQKMSKSKGNGVEPREMMQKYGIDALRMSFYAGNKAGMDVKFSEKKVEGYAKFVNKIWNAAKLVEMKLESSCPTGEPIWENLQLKTSKWLLAEFEKLKQEAVAEVSKFNLNIAFEKIYHFCWDKFCAWYLEIAKVLLDRPEYREEVQLMMTWGLKQTLALLHPFAPFFTETIYREMNCISKKHQLLATLQLDFNTLRQEREFTNETEQCFEIISAIREFRKNTGIGYGEVIKIKLDQPIDKEMEFLISKIGKVHFVDSELAEVIRKPILGSLTLQIACPIDTKRIYLLSLKKQADELQKAVSIDERKLTPEFINKAPEELVNEVQANYQQNKKNLALLVAELNLN